MHPILENLQKSLGINLKSEPDLEKVKRTYSANTYAQAENGEITGLNLCNGNWTDAQLREIWNLPDLRVVQLSGNQLQKLILPDSLTRLEWLDLSDNKDLYHLEFTGDSTQLAYLEASDSGLQKLIFPKTAEKLERLDAARNRIETISLPAELPALERLDLGSNKLSHFLFPSGSTSLSHVFLDKNELKEIVFPDHQSDYLPDTLHLRLDENTLSDDLQANIDNSNAFPFIRQWLADKRVATDEDKDYKVLVLGNGGVGKSSLIDRMVDNTFEEDRPSTHAIRLVRFERSGFPYVLNFWDFGGQDIYHATHRIFLQTNAVYLLLWDKETEDKALKGEPTIYIEDEEKREYINEPLAYWMHYANFFGKGSPVIIVQTKTIKHGGLKLECPEKSKLIAIYEGKFLEFTHTDAGTHDYRNGFKALALNLENAILSIARQGQTPASWLALRKYFTNLQEKIQQARERKEEPEIEKTLTLDAFEALVKKYQINTESSFILNWLKETGVLFYRKDMFNNRIILDQEWAIRAIYTIFSRGKGGAYYQILSQQGRFTGADLAKIWDKFETPEQQLFLDFMLTCELCFELKDEKHSWKPFMERTFIAPQMLKPEKPRAIAALENSWKLGPEPRFIQLRFTHPFLHYGIIQGFIVRAYQLASVDEIFRYGILLEWEGENAVVEALSDQEIRITGPRASTRLIPMIRGLFHQLEYDGRWKEEISLDGGHFELLDEKSELSSIFNLPAKGKQSGSGRADFESLPGDPYSGRQSLFSTEIPPPPKLRILFLTACPAGSDPIQTDKEFAVIYRSVSENVRLEVDHAVTSDNLIDKALEKDYPIIHFSGHGTEGDYDNKEDAGLIFHNDGQNGRIILNEQKLHNIFKAIKKQKQGLKIAFLNACFSTSQAKAISEVGVHAIGFEGKLNDEAAWKFSAGFYKHFEKTGDIKESVEMGALKAQVIDTDILTIVNLFHNGETIPLDLN